MDRPHIRQKNGPEWHIQQRLLKYLRNRGWLVEVSNGNMFQRGWPDLYLAHKQFGQRWVDVKNPKRYTFTNDQKEKWPIWDAHGVGIWILVDATEEEYDKLWQPPNWRKYWKPSWDTKVVIDDLLDEIDNDRST